MSRKTPAEDAAELRLVVQEAHGAIKDLTRVIREAKTTIVEVKAAARDAVQNDMGEAIKAGLDELMTAMTKAIETAEDRVNARFDKVADIMLGEEPKSVRNGEPSLTDYATQIAALRNRKSEETS